MPVFRPTTIPVLLLVISCNLFSSNLMADGQLQQFSVTQIREDFHQLYFDLKKSHNNLFANVTETQYQQHFQATLQKINEPMTESAIRLLFQRFVALGEIAHASIDLPISDFFSYRERGGTMLPLFVKIKDGSVVVDEYYGENKTLKPGTRITALNGLPIENWVARCSALLSADTPELAATLIETRFPFLIWLLAGEQPEFSIAIESQDGTQLLTVKALSREEQDQYASEATAPEVKARDWKLLDGNIGWIKPGPFYNIQPGAEDVWDNSEFIDFVDEAMLSFTESNARALIIDVRDNPGGTNSFSDHLIAWIADQPFRFASDFQIRVSEHAIAANAKRLRPDTSPDNISYQLAKFYEQKKWGEIASFNLPLQQPHKDKHFDKPVFLLINRYSYSNAVNVAAILKDYGMATLIGEPTADFATTYGAMEHFYLQHTGIKVGFPKALIIRPNGDDRPGSVSPDIPINMDLAGSEQEIVEMVRKRILTELHSSD